MKIRYEFQKKVNQVNVGEYLNSLGFSGGINKYGGMTYFKKDDRLFCIAENAMWESGKTEVYNYKHIPNLEFIKQRFNL